MCRYLRVFILVMMLTASGIARAQYASAVQDSSVRISAYMQHGSDGKNKDWHCGTMSYSRPGYAHQGTDYAIPWIQRGVSYAHVPVVSGVRGKIIATYADCADVCLTGDCICANAQGTGNFVKIEDRFGRIRVFMHLRKKSINVHVGDTVEAETIIGEIGSSGYSTGPHLHDEFRDGDEVIEPFAGNCAHIDEYERQVSLWNTQHDYQSVPSSEIYACSIEPGRYIDGFHDAISRKAFQRAYGYRGYAPDISLGCPSSLDGSLSVVHDVAGIDVQDFVQSNPKKRFSGSDDGHTALVRKPGSSRAYLLHSGFWGTYKCLPMNIDVNSRRTMGVMGGATWLGAPIDNEHRPSVQECAECIGDPLATWQNFERGYMSYQFDGVIRVHIDGQDSTIESVLAHAVSQCGASLMVQGNPPMTPQPTTNDGKINSTFEWTAPISVSAQAVEVWGSASPSSTSWQKLCTLGIAGSNQKYICTHSIASYNDVTFAIRFMDARLGERWVFDHSCSPQGGCGQSIGEVTVRIGSKVVDYDLIWNGYGSAQYPPYFNGYISQLH